ncbi:MULTISPECIES: polysaccharide biosynthesis C-terminal domain-containing protein [unclassified Pantoea]|uniref:oligosaccharide flippase family protein n=1 Tax=unclassified Pantoea TaxID=2630326 RepID=UPI001CD2D974|nr:MULTISPECIES: polysaccharide biosynthesis C-terminal domain-containing protein [unclassified Pantoea]MCA1176781.1 polysaccharide biosynthesis C-terminal domain-containing protein [Pantoea sp. alder69]MCA1251233.1 polysaccharide biosynthesis C-terminal domain-containing protein [Pantoea sp. alder70]MCA1265618.1 polysaccharide biosynthesis C-terminal domain-containing protein [Pantoea sp. alder81]
MKLSVMSNAAWMMSEKIVSVFGVIFVTSYVAKSFGPTIFGQMAFSTSLFSMVQTVAIFGTETILFKRISKSAPKGLRLMTVARTMRLVLLLLTSIPVLIWVWYNMQENFLAFALASFISSVFVTQDTFSVYNNARLASRLNTVANSVGLLLGFILSFTIAWLHLNPLWLTLSIVMVTLVPYVIKRSNFYRENQDMAPPQEKRNTYLRYLLYAGLPLAISSIFISVQVKAAQMFLAGIVSARDLGLFAAANTIAASWIFIPVAIITSCFSEIFRERGAAAIKLTARLNGYVMGVSLLLLAVIALYGEQIIIALYGHEYTQSGSLITLLSLATCFSAMGTVAYRYMVKEGGFNYLLKKIVCLMVISLPLSWWLIQGYGIMGAAWSVFISELLSFTVMNYFFNNGVIQKIQVSSLNYKTYK